MSCNVAVHKNDASNHDAYVPVTLALMLVAVITDLQ